MDALFSQQQSRSGSMSAASVNTECSKHADEHQPLPYGVSVQPLVAATPG
jgi:hypothetical protein